MGRFITLAAAAGLAPGAGENGRPMPTAAS
jgi:hypothetical protein